MLSTSTYMAWRDVSQRVDEDGCQPPVPDQDRDEHHGGEGDASEGDEAEVDPHDLSAVGGGEEGRRGEDEHEVQDPDPALHATRSPRKVAPVVSVRRTVR